MSTVTEKIPDGYEPFLHAGGYIDHNGPYYSKTQDDGSFRYGFMTDHRHGNPNNVLHGAAMTGFIDTVFGHLIVYTLKRMCATVTLNAEFISGVPAGGWIEATAEIKQATKSMAWVRGDVFSGDQLLLSASGVWRVFDRPMEQAIQQGSR